MIKLNELLQLPFPLVLASQSPRRQSLLKHIGFDFSVVNPDVDEDSVPHNLPHGEYVQRLALMKARRGAELVTEQSIVIGSDTTVVFNGQVLNKPRDAAHAREMLALLSGNTHTVYTGIALALSENHEVSQRSSLNAVLSTKFSQQSSLNEVLSTKFSHEVSQQSSLNEVLSTEFSHHSSTQVTFRDLSSEEISMYVETGSPLDKAGAYGIQDDFGAVFVSRVEGCYYTIVGLPLEMLYTSLREFATRISAKA